MKKVPWFGIFLIIVGLFLLFSELGLINIGWRELLKFWPLIFVFWGLDLIVGEKRWFGWLMLLLLIAFIGLLVYLSSFAPTPFYRGRDNRGPYYREWRYPFQDGIKTFELDINSGVANFNFKSLPKGEKDFLVISSDSEFRVNKLKEYSDKELLHLSIGIENYKKEDLFFSKESGRVEININPDLNLSLSYEGGVGNTNLDLRDMKLKKLSIKGGVGNINTYLPKVSSDIEVKGGIGNIVIYVPEGASLDLVSDVGIGKINVDQKIERQKDGDDVIIHLKVESGIGNISIKSIKDVI
ncbi:MAG TPA: DUF5668 domain-containing protein [Dictyoglomaceae bacterium]|nr:DUF5668 domain-containing protein [Dictyoglomaceae bacterium]HOL39831.1 DUF5668 domain-containing protein [Dictyoglomaceae bacterium]HPP16309.1 DUF5668 domain-containing protein [Dictyoglomaceae bacterium]